MLNNGWENRRVAGTSINEVSSRSHAIFTLRVKMTCAVNDITTIKNSVLNLVDLAGSERQKYSLVRGERAKVIFLKLVY